VRDAAHYQRMLQSSRNATVGATLAAAAVYAARHGQCEDEDRKTPAYRAIYRDLVLRYGETMATGAVLREMDAARE
jgi:hypothetical protein